MCQLVSDTHTLNSSFQSRQAYARSPAAIIGREVLHHISSVLLRGQVELSITWAAEGMHTSTGLEETMYCLLRYSSTSTPAIPPSTAKQHQNTCHTTINHQPTSIKITHMITPAIAYHHQQPTSIKITHMIRGSIIIDIDLPGKQNWSFIIHSPMCAKN